MSSDQFKFSERLGIFFTVEGAFLSVASVTFILCFSGYRWMKSTLLKLRGRSGLSRPFDASDSSLFINLMFADLIQALGALPNIRWMNRGSIIEDSICKTQAVLNSLAIAIHTFCILVLRWKARPHFSKFVVLGVWVATGFIIGMGNAGKRNKQYYGDTGYWCWILPRFKVEQIVTEYLWVWLAGASMVILYGIMFVVIRGWLTIGERDDTGPDLPETEDDRRTKAIANSMLYYPAVYIFCVFPNTLSRWLFFSGFTPPYQFTLFANTLYALSGMFNLILFFVTRPEVVVGPRSTATDSGPAPVNSYHDQNSSINPPGGRNNPGHLPERRLAEPSDDMSHMAQQSDREFSPLDLYKPSPSLVKQTSAGSRLTGTSLHPEWDGEYPTRYSGPPSPAAVNQHDDLGRLPS